jgi:cell wall-associated NlpC family hydrolase
MKEDILSKVSDMIGKPYGHLAWGPDAYDCQGVVVEVSKRLKTPFIHKDIDITAPTEFHEIYLYMKNLEDYYEKQDSPEPGDIVPIYYPLQSIVSHIGIMVTKSQFMHSRERVGVAVERIDSIQWKKRIAGFYRYAGPKPI